jgi:putative DNA primase/helicase
MGSSTKGPQSGKAAQDAPNIKTPPPPRSPTAQERERLIYTIRSRMVHPAEAMQADEHGVMRWVKAPIRCLENIEVALGTDPVFAKKIDYDAFAGRLTYDGAEVTDAVVTEITIGIGRTFDLRVPSAQVAEVMAYLAERRWARNPLQDYLAGLVWDGVPRLDTLLQRALGVPDSPLYRAISRAWAISAAARALKPGCKVDTVLILAGKQGAGKSTWCRTLFGAPFFCDTRFKLGDKDALQGLRGVWCYELAELASTRAKDAEEVKAFLSAQEDRFRPPYGRSMITLKRSTVFVGTTNQPTFLADPTGARRFWPVSVGKIDLVWTAANRDQVWAEAAAAVAAGEAWWLDTAQEQAIEDARGVYEHDDPWHGPIESMCSDAVKRQEGITARDVLVHTLGKDLPDCSRGDEMRVAGILGALGWSKRRGQTAGRREIRWYP